MNEGLIAVFCLLLCIFYIYMYVKEKRALVLISAILWLLIPCLRGIGMRLHSEKLTIAALVFPIGLLFVIAFLEAFLRYKNCGCLVSATYISYFRIRAGRGFFSSNKYSPKFSFRYRGEDFEASSFVNYSENNFFRLFVKNYKYDIYIDPRNPKRCIDARYSPTGLIVGLILSLIIWIICMLIILF